MFSKTLHVNCYQCQHVLTFGNRKGAWSVLVSLIVLLDFELWNCQLSKLKCFKSKVLKHYLR